MIVVYGRNERWLACDFESLNRKVIFCRWHCPRSGSMILRAQIVHINKGEGKPLLFRAILLFFYLLSTTSTLRRPYIHPSSTLHPPRIDLTSTQAVCVTTHKGSWIKLLLCLISIVTRSSSHLVREMNQTQGSKHCCLFRKTLRKRAISRIFKIS